MDLTGIGGLLLVVAVIVGVAFWLKRRAFSNALTETGDASGAGSVELRMSAKPLDRGRVTARPTADYPLAIGGNYCQYTVVGTSHRQETLGRLRSALLGRARRGQAYEGWEVFVAELRAEPTNEYDPKAIAVDAVDYGHIGYIPAGDCSKYHPLLGAVRQRERPLRCHGQVFKFPDGALGVRLDLAAPRTVASNLGTTLRALLEEQGVSVPVRPRRKKLMTEPHPPNAPPDTKGPVGDHRAFPISACEY
jgi:hypothetical protein